MTSPLGNRIKEARNKVKLRQDELAHNLDIHVTTLNKYEKGHRIPDAELLGRMANVLGADPGWLLMGVYEKDESREDSIRRRLQVEGASQEEVSQLLASGGSIVDREATAFKPSDEYVYIPQVTGEISAGGGLIPDNTVEMRIAFRREWIERKGDPVNMSLIRVSGDSMEPTLISGDLVLIDHNRQHLDPQGGVYAISMDHTIMIKRLQLIYSTQQLRIISDNNRYETLNAVPDQVTINGKVIWYGREIER